MNIKKKIFQFSQLLLFANWAMQTCNRNILKIIIAIRLKHGQLTEDDEITWCKLKKLFF